MAFGKTFSAHFGFAFLILILGHLFALPLPTLGQTGHLVSRNGTVLNVLVPVKTDFTEFVDCSDNSNVKGFCIDVFKFALSILIPKAGWTDVKYDCYPIGDDSYDTMISLLGENQSYDAVVGDTTISAARMMTASFTQTFLDSGIVIVTQDEGVPQSFPGVFFSPFTAATWAITVASMFLTGAALWLLERNDHPSFARAETIPEKLKAIFWCVTGILILLKRDSIMNPLSKFIVIAWIIFVLLLGSSYTASLSSILTVNHLSQKALTIDELSAMNESVGYQTGSIVKDYLEKRHNITKLVPLYNATQYGDALRSKKIVALVDEIPYISLFLAAQPASNCRFSVGEKLTIEGFGFAFYNRTISSAFSMAVLNLSESGEIQRLQDGWKLSNFQCPSTMQSTQLDLTNSQGLFALLGGAIALFIALSLLIRLVIPSLSRNYVRFRGNEMEETTDFQDPSS